MKIAAIASGIALLALSGCAAMKEGGGSGGGVAGGGVRTRILCTANPCPVTVTVTGNCVVTTDPYTLDIPPGNTNDIVWTIQNSPGWEFQKPPMAKGIEFKHGHGGGGFSPGNGSGTVFVYHNNHSPGQHDYNVNVTNGAMKCTQDPTIVNH